MTDRLSPVLAHLQRKRMHVATRSIVLQLNAIMQVPPIIMAALWNGAGHYISAL